MFDRIIEAANSVAGAGYVLVAMSEGDNTCWAASDRTYAKRSVACSLAKRLQNEGTRYYTVGRFPNGPAVFIDSNTLLPEAF